MRRFGFALSAVFALAIMAVPADAQLKFGGHAAMISSIDEVSSLDGSFGVGGRVGAELPALPIGAYGSVTYYFPDGDDLSYWTGSVFGKLGLPLPIVSPYALVGIQRRAASVGDVSESDNGFFAGVGVGFSSLFIEATFEFVEDDPAFPDFDNDPLVFKGGFIIG